MILTYLIVVEYNWLCLHIKLYLKKLEFVVFDSKINFHTQIFNSTHFYINVLKHKSLLIIITFNWNQFHIINNSLSKLIFITTQPTAYKSSSNFDLFIPKKCTPSVLRTILTRQSINFKYLNKLKKLIS